MSTIAQQTDTAADMIGTATYSPDDNKLRLYPFARLDAETYQRVKSAGFAWAPKQELFVAGCWTPGREDLLLELCGEIDDEDKTLTERAEDRAERFEDYSEKREREADQAHKAVSRIADNIPLGQPILVGHHSERHARKDAERIQNGMRKAVKMWETSKYWTSRAAGAIRHAKHHEAPGVRHRRIKTIEAEKRKSERDKSEADMWLKLWNECDAEPDKELQAAVALRIANMCWLHLPRKEGDREDFHQTPTAYDALTNGYPTLYAPRTLDEIIAAARATYPAAIANCDRWLAHLENRLTYERAMLGEQLGIDPASDIMGARFAIEVGGRVLVERDEWSVVLRVNRAEGRVNSVTCTAPAYVTWSKTWKYGIEKVRDYRPPSEEETAQVKRATKLPPLCNYPGDGFKEMTEAEWKAVNRWSDFPYIGNIAATETTGAHRVRQVPAANYKKQRVYITDGKRIDPPAKTPKPEAPIREPAASAEPRPERAADPRDAEFAALKERARDGVKVVVVPQLFETPADLAVRMVELAEIEPGHDVLEPSAGTAAILRALPCVRPGGSVTAVEINETLATGHVEEHADRVEIADFLTCNGSLGTFDRVLMNPPFQNAADIKHIEHALTMLKPGGRLVAICANGPRQVAKLKPQASHWEELPADTFKDQGAGVRAALLVIDRPETLL